MRWAISAMQKSLYAYSTVRDTLRVRVPRPTKSSSWIGIYPRDFQLRKPPRPSTSQFEGSTSASFTTASYAVSQSTLMTFLRYASAISTSAFDPPCVLPLHSDMRQSGR